MTEHSTHTQASIIFNIVHQLFSVCSKYVTMIAKDCKLGSLKLGYLLGKKKMCHTPYGPLHVPFRLQRRVCVCVFFRLQLIRHSTWWEEEYLGQDQLGSVLLTPSLLLWTWLFPTFVHDFQRDCISSLCFMWFEIYVYSKVKYLSY